MKKYPLIQFFFLFITITLLISACVPQTQVIMPTMQTTHSVTQTPSPTPAATQVVVKAAGLQPITSNNIQEIELLYELGTDYSYDAALSPDGKILAVLTKNKIIVYNRDTFEEKFSVSVEIPSNSVITFSPDGKQIVYSNTNQLIFLDTNDGTYIDSFSFGSSFNSILNIIFIPKNDRLLITGFNHDGLYGIHCFALFDFDGNKLFEREYANQDWRYLFKFLDNQRTALLIYIDNSEEIIPLQTFIIENNTGNVLAASIWSQNYKLPDEAAIFGASTIVPTRAEMEDWVRLHKTISADKQPPDCVDLLEYNASNVLDMNETTALLERKEHSSKSKGTSICILEIDLQTCNLIHHINFPSFHDNATFSPDDHYIVEENKYSTYVWDLSDGSMWLESLGKLTDYTTPITSFNSDGSLFLLYPHLVDDDIYSSIEKEKKSITLFNLQTGDILNKLNFGDGNPLDIFPTFSPDIMIITFREKISIWNISSLKHIADIPKGSFILDPSRNGIWVLSPEGHSYQTPELYNLNTGALIKQFFHLEHNFGYEMFLTEDYSILEITFDGKSIEKDYIHIDIETGKMIDHLYHESTSDNNHIDLQGPEQSKWFFAAPDNKARYTYHESTKEVIGPFFVEPSIEHARWTEPNDYSFWDVESGEFLGFIITDFPISNMILSPNHYYLAFLGGDGIIRIYGVKENQ